MNQADRKLGLFYQHQIAKIAALARKQPSPSSRKRLDSLLNEYIDMLLAMPAQSERGTSAKVRPILAGQQRRRAAGAVIANEGKHQR
jgi:hypothetical protein